MGFENIHGTLEFRERVVVVVVVVVVAWWLSLEDGYILHIEYHNPYPSLYGVVVMVVDVVPISVR